jgi:uncharacterized cupredoxin-like copper-binding protein
MTRLVAAVAGLALLAACGGGDADAPARVVEVKALDTLRFDPATIASKPGEAVELRITNTGAQPHEFVIGDAAYQQAHDAAMGGGGHEGHGGSAVRLEAGETKTLAFTMPSTPPTYACHLAGHDDAGMTGTVTY